MSTFDVYTSLFNIYGAMYKGDPKAVCVKSSLFFNFLQKPKSANLSLPFMNRILSVLISL